MQYSENLHLNLPEDTDPLEISKLSENFVKLDDFAELADPFQVGDILSTLRTDLGNKWLLCNGEAFDSTEYPELAQLSEGGLVSMGTKAKSRTIGTSNTASTWPTAYATDGTNQLIAYGYYTEPNSGNTPTQNKVYWSNDNFKTNVQKTISVSDSYIKPFYANGHWIIFTGRGITQDPYPKRFMRCYAQSEPFSSFSSPTDLTSANSTIGIHDVLHVEYVNGSYYAFCVTYPTANLGNRTLALSFSVLSSPSPNFQSAAIQTVWNNVLETTSSARPTPFFCRMEDKFVFLGFLSYNSGRLYKIAYCSTPTGAYQTRTLDTTGQSEALRTSAPIVVGGKFVWLQMAGLTSPYPLRLAYLDNLATGSVSYVSLDKSTSTNACSGLIDCGGGTYAFFLNRQKYIYVGQGDILQASNWVSGSLSDTPLWDQMSGVAYVKDGSVNTSISGGIISIPQAAVPSISVDGCYTYIKAK